MEDENKKFDTENTIYSLEEIMKFEKPKEEKSKKHNNILKDIITDKLFITVIIFLIFIMSCLIVYEAYTLKNKVDEYENLIVTVEKEDKEIKVYGGNNNSEDTQRKGAMSEYINCLNSSVDTDNIPDSIKEAINKINDYYNSDENHFAYVYKDLYTGFTVSYNENQSIFAASAIKAPTDIYIFEQAAAGKIDLDEKLKYTGAYYSNGSGVLKEKELDTVYDVRTLLGYSTITSDNAAHNMLMDRYGRENMHAFWTEKGTKDIFRYNTNWGNFCAKDCSIYMEELYNFYLNNEEYGKEVMNNFIKSYPKFIKSSDDYNVASKSGWSGSSLHDVAIVFADNPYIVVALSNLGASSYEEYFNTVSKLSEELHSAYWKYKIDSCDSIKQY